MRYVHEAFRIHRAETIDLLKRLIRIPSVNPGIEGGEGEHAIADCIAKWFRKKGKFHIYEQKVSKNRFNVVALLAGKGDGHSLMLNGHMDTVGTSNMTINPFHPFTAAGRVHGRGSCDMKGPIASMMSAMEALANSKVKLGGDVLFAAVVDEEALSVGTAELIKRFRTDAAIVGEPTGMNIAIAHKGYAWLEIETEGKRAHGSMPERGIDAIEKMAKIISQFQSIRRKHRSRKHRLVGTPRIHTSTILGGSDWSTIPAKCLLRIERRLIPGETPQDALNELRDVVRECAARDKMLRAEVRLIHHAGSMDVRPNTAHISILRKHVRIRGYPGRIVGVPYWTDASILVNEARIPSCLFGPGDIAVAHSPDEYIRLDDVVIAAQIYAQTALDYCNSD